MGVPDLTRLCAQERGDADIATSVDTDIGFIDKTIIDFFDDSTYLKEQIQKS